MKKILIFIFIINILIGDSLEDLLKVEEYSFDYEEEYTEKKISIDKVIGDIYLEGEEDYLNLLGGDGVEVGNTIITLDMAEGILNFDSDIKVLISQKSIIKILTLLGEVEEEKIEIGKMEVILGKIYAKIDRTLDKGSRFEVKGGSIVAGVRGTEFSLNIDKEGFVTIKVFEGKVEVRDKVEKVIEVINKGEYIKINKEGRITIKREHTDTFVKFEKEKFEYELIEIINDINTNKIDTEYIKEKLDNLIENEKEFEKKGENTRDVIINIS